MDNENNTGSNVVSLAPQAAPPKPTYTFQFKDDRPNQDHTGFLFVTPQVAGVSEEDNTINVVYPLEDVASVVRTMDA
jgi:hypothetical protein